MPKSIVKKPWGKEKIWYVSDDEKVQFKTLHINAGEQTSLQYHRNKVEIVFPLDANAILDDGGKQKKLKPHFSQQINSGKVHRYKAVGGPTVLAELNCGDDTDIVRIEDKYGRVLNGNGVKEVKKGEKAVVKVEEKKADV